MQCNPGLEEFPLKFQGKLELQYLKAQNTQENKVKKGEPTGNNRPKREIRKTSNTRVRHRI